LRYRAAGAVALGIPFALEIVHSTMARSVCDSVVVRVEDDEGNVGYGEAVPRPYVGGETVDSVLEVLRDVLWPAVVAASPDDGRSEPAALLAAIDEALPDAPVSGGVVAHNAARAGLELALLDVGLRRRGASLGDVLPARRETVTYSGLVPGGSLRFALEMARQELAFGITALKIKLGRDDDLERCTQLRELAGPEFPLYADVNTAWSLEQALDRLPRLEELGLRHIEQPFPRGRLQDMRSLRQQSGVPVMVDESLVTLEDAHRLIEAEACDLFNLRISKCGGIARVLALAELAEQNGLRYQLGCHVGETSILAAAGRHLALALRAPAFVEGSIGSFLLRSDVTEVPVQFAEGGIGGVLEGPGLGIEVLDARLREHSVRQVDLSGALS